MSSSDGEDFGAFLAGFLIGGLLGAGAALLLAPQSGEETRAQIRDKSVELRSQAEEQVKAIQVQAEKTLAEVRSQAAEIQANAAKTLEETRARISGMVDGKNTEESMG